MTFTRSALIAIALVLLLWPADAGALAPARVRGSVRNQPALGGTSEMYFYLRPTTARGGDFGIEVHQQTATNPNVNSFDFTIPDYNFIANTRYTLDVYIVNQQRIARKGSAPITAAGGNFSLSAVAYSGNLPLTGTGDLLLLAGLLLAIVTFGLLLWRRSRLRALAQPA